ncbi:uncharacterized protein LOC120286284 [Eucalyptus grandis]|uniref:uncharacterized protein LOC120286284 n=1 Tax=Eucalyptus grandis TaxID=71139 RepID=UPI00192EEE3F|nr:uncharacterized protein LOC120286284 [Eucalyptus grandis]
MLIDPAVAIVWDVLKMVVVPIKRQFGYVISSKSYAQNLQKEVGKLAYEAERIHNAAEVARNNLQNVYSHVMEWEASAEQALKEARDLLGEFEESSKTCCHGTLPDPCCHYQFSRKAKDKIKDILQLAQEGRDFRDISFSDPAPGNVVAPTPATREGTDAVQSTTMMASASCASESIKLRDDGIFESRASIIQDIIDALANNSNSVVGVHGVGGVGKSTLLVDAEKRIREKTLFDLVAKADVSANPDIKRIQEEIAHELGLDFKNEEFVSVRAKLLCKRLEADGKKKNVLIILDNLWERLDLKSVGIPCGHDNKVIGCKLLLTSRDRNVLQREMGCDKEFPLDRLKENEARTLFESMVGDKVHENEFRPLVDEALRKCARLPLLIVTVAKRFKYAGLSEWRDVLNQIERCSNEGISAVINKMLQLSYDHLESEEAKSLLQLCVAYGVSEPSLENLVRYGYGLGIFRKDSSMNEARDRLSTHIHTLQASSLLLDNGGADGFKIHDLVHDFVAQFILRDRPLLVLKDKDILATQLQNERLKSCSAICFPYIDIKELPKELDCPELRMFLLFTNNEPLEIPDSFFNSMKKLAVLNLTSIHLTRSLTSFQFSENLHTLCLQRCFLEDVAILSKLKGLQVLSFVNSNFQRLPKEIGQLTELRLLDLNHCSHIQIIEPGVLERLIKLEELYMENSFDQWNAIEQTQPTNASLIELNCLKNLCTLHISIPDPSMLPKDLDVEKLTKYKIRIGNAMRLRKHKGSRVLDLKLDLINDVLRTGCIQSILSKTDDLFLDKLSKSEQSICALSPQAFPKLKHLLVQNSHFVHYILRWCSLNFFEMLESLLLENLVNLKKICYSHISSSKSFSTLKVIQVKSCDKMEVLFPLSLLRGLPQLEEIKVVGCKLMRSIVEADDCGKVELCNLHALELRHLPNIKNFFTAGTTPSSSTLDDQVGTQVAFFNGQQISIPSLESLKMEGLPNMKEIWSDDSPLELSNLQFVEVVQCKSLSKVINSKLLVELHKLHSLCIRDCNSVQEIFDLDEPSGNGNVKTLYELTTLKLVNLQSLRCIWNKNPYGIVSFHNLNKLEVDRCDNLRFMFFPSMVKSLVQLRDLRVQHVEKMEAIIMEEEGLGLEASETPTFPMLTNLTLTSLECLKCFSLEKCSRETRTQDYVKSNFAALFNQEISIPSLESLTMEGLPNIKEIWSDQSLLGLSNLRSLKVVQCKSLSKVISFESLVKLHELHNLSISNCHSVQEIFDLDRPSASGDVETLSELTTFDLRGLGSLRCIWNKNPCGIVSFHNLKKLEVHNCPNLRFMFFPTMVKSLELLRDLTVKCCKKMEAIIMEEEGSGLETSKTLAFPMLTNLNLQRLESLMCFSCGKHSQEARSQDYIKSSSNALFGRQVAFPSLETLHINDMDNIEMIWDNQAIANSFPKLKSLFVDKCNKFVTVVPSYILGRLLCLESLTVKACASLEVVFQLQPPNPLDGHHVALLLKKLTLSNLPTLKCIWDKEIHRQVKFQCLCSISVSECKSLTSLFPTLVARDLIQLEELEIYECGIVELIEKEEGPVPRFDFPKLTSLKLELLIELKCIYTERHALHWPALKTLEVLGCNKVEILVSQPKNEMPLHKHPLFFIEKGAFPSLQELKLDLSKRMEIWHRHFHDGEFFNKLRFLELRHLSQESSISTSCFVESLPNLEELVVCESYLEDPSSIKEAIEGRSHELKVILPFSRYIRHLQTLDVSLCDGLSNMFTPTIAENLVALTKLKISNCRILTEVISDEESEEGCMSQDEVLLRGTNGGAKARESTNKFE